MADVAARALAGSGVAVREAGPLDAVGGVRPGLVALPESVEEISALLRACAAADLATVTVGGGTKLDWGAPPERCDVLIDTCCMNEIIEHAAGDLVVRAQAGVTLAALAAHLAAQGQELVYDGPFRDEATVGGLLATGATGPRSFRYGTPRDLLIGITVVLADGTIAKSGGKVVKNVAGYDLGKLFTGSFGTLGVIAEATFRLHPLAAERVWVRTRVAPPQVQEFAVRLAAAQAEPAAVELDWPGTSGPVTIAALVEGAAAERRARALLDSEGDGGGLVGEGGRGDGEGDADGGEVALMGGHGGMPAWWGEVGDGEWLAEVRCLPDRVSGVLGALEGSGLALRGSPVSGRFFLWGDGSEAGAGAGAGFGFGKAVDGLRGAGARVSVLASPYAVDRWGEVSALPLMRRVKERFDPGRRMSPGRFVGGI
ncbi:FAD-binding oxidoreductase [Nonomuraea sp. NPDC050790]|uniref:FAD-binding oxidoreductase n=1 Tax=Nonomuraea sp. NPDC050790 TaxID=3364371 RepID=UPI00379A0B36